MILEFFNESNMLLIHYPPEHLQQSMCVLWTLPEFMDHIWGHRMSERPDYLREICYLSVVLSAKIINQFLCIGRWFIEYSVGTNIQYSKSLYGNDVFNFTTAVLTANAII